MRDLSWIGGIANVFFSRPTSSELFEPSPPNDDLRDVDFIAPARGLGPENILDFFQAMWTENLYRTSEGWQACSIFFFW